MNEVPAVEGVPAQEILWACQNIMTFGKIVQRHPVNVTIANIMGIEIGILQESYYVPEKIDYSLPKTVNGVRRPRLADALPANRRRISFSGGIFWGGWIDFGSGVHYPKSEKSLSIVNGKIVSSTEIIYEPTVKWGKELHRYIGGEVSGDTAIFQKQMLCLKLLGEDTAAWKELMS